MGEIADFSFIRRFNVLRLTFSVVATSSGPKLGGSIYKHLITRRMRRVVVIHYK